MQLVELERGISLPEYFRAEYVEGGKRMADVAAALGVDVGTVSRWMAHFGIPARRSAA